MGNLTTQQARIYQVNKVKVFFLENSSNIFGEPWRLTHKITTFCFMASNRRYIHFFKFGLAVFLLDLFLRDITFNESGAVIAVHANAVTIDRSVV